MSGRSTDTHLARAQASHDVRIAQYLASCSALDRAEELNGVCPVQNITLGIRAALAIPATEETDL